MNSHALQRQGASLPGNVAANGIGIDRNVVTDEMRFVIKWAQDPQIDTIKILSDLRPRIPRDWMTSGSARIGKRVRRAVLDAEGNVSSFADATVSGFLPARFSNFVSEFTKLPAALWRVRYDSADMGEEDLELVELEDAMRAYNSDSWSGSFTGKSLKQHGNSKIKKKQDSLSRSADTVFQPAGAAWKTTDNQHAGKMIGQRFFGKSRVGQGVGWTSITIDSPSCSEDIDACVANRKARSNSHTDMEGKGSRTINRTAVPRRKKIARLLEEATRKDNTEEKTGDGCWGKHEGLLGESSRATGRKDAEWLHEDQDLGTLSTEELTLLQTLSVIFYHASIPIGSLHNTDDHASSPY